MGEGNRVKHSPLDQAHRRAGARMVPFGGWEMPLSYPSGTLAEHMTCRTGAVLFDVSHLGTVRVQGPGALARLQGALSNDLAKIGPGRAQYTHLLDNDGSVLDDIIVWWVAAERFDVMPNASNTEQVRQAIGGADVTSSRAVLALQGPKARAVLGTVSPEAAAVPRSHVEVLGWDGPGGSVDLVVAGTGYTGEDGVELAVPAGAALDLWQALVEAGAVPAGLGARDTLRLESGLPLHGHELGAGVTPLDAGLAWVVAWDKAGGFRGREALVAQRETGPLVRLRGVRGETRQPLRQGYEVLAGGQPVGQLSSGNFSPVLGVGIGMCFVPIELVPGTDLEVEARGQRLAARLTALPFVAKAATSARTGPLPGAQH